MLTEPHPGDVGVPQPHAVACAGEGRAGNPSSRSLYVKRIGRVAAVRGGECAQFTGKSFEVKTLPIYSYVLSKRVSCELQTTVVSG